MHRHSGSINVPWRFNLGGKVFFLSASVGQMNFPHALPVEKGFS